MPIPEQEFYAVRDRCEQFRASLTEIADLPFTMVNDSDSLRHTIRAMQSIARKSLNSKSG